MLPPVYIGRRGADRRHLPGVRSGIVRRSWATLRLRGRRLGHLSGRFGARFSPREFRGDVDDDVT